MPASITIDELEFSFCSSVSRADALDRQSTSASRALAHAVASGGGSCTQHVAAIASSLSRHSVLAQFKPLMIPSTSITALGDEHDDSFPVAMADDGVAVALSMRDQRWVVELRRGSS